MQEHGSKSHLRFLRRTKENPTLKYKNGLTRTSDDDLTLKINDGLNATRRTNTTNYITP